MFDWCPDAYFFQKTVTVLVVMVSADAADQICEEQQRMIDHVLCISLLPLCCLPQVPSAL
jgi:hypothetical protein